MKKIPSRLFCRVGALLLICGACSTPPVVKKPNRPWQLQASPGYVEVATPAFNSRFVVRVWGPDKTAPVMLQSLNRARAEIQRIAKMADASNPLSEVSRINQFAYREPVKISAELSTIFNTCEQMYQISDHKFDVTFLPYRADGKDEFNAMTDWDGRPSLTANPSRLFGSKNLILDQGPPRVRLYNRRLKVNLNGMIRGYAAESALKLIASLPGISGAAVIVEGLVAASGVALQDPGLMCIESPTSLGKCAYRVTPADSTQLFFLGASASAERRGEIYDPNDTWTYRSGGVVSAGRRGDWVQFATTITSLMDDLQLSEFYVKTKATPLAGVYSVTEKGMKGSLLPLASVAPGPR